ncbi:MAG: hypothetical protein IKF83_02495 [Clostridia bacterium]|nr:hypothetical protein [Clostridia bacterium]
MTRAYCEAAVEVLDILDHTSEYKVNLIPTKFINYLKENAANDYVAKIDYSKPINEMNVKIETMGILGTICRNWWWNNEEKQEYARLVREKEIKHQEELREKYNPDDIFKKKKQQEIESENIDEINNSSYQMLEYKENIFSKILNFIKRMFNRK